MAWTIEFHDRALRDLKRLARIDAGRIVHFLEARVAAVDDPRSHGAAMQGVRFDHLWRYRAGDYRIICDIQDHRLVVLVISVGHRRDVYR
ncbi:type II toxin-antitoxin system RelE/ParE family toxin [Devosia sp.]|uniref:type II toxin-antitoxin system RelE family toxin n=1 Tax=Devosia sp. TaxID=1871048 RepID=UPI0026370240|nr:type II toxin-antitoxin system RelE/ParE family toxin [Devosia sp.]